jgi:hypothetical protein
MPGALDWLMQRLGGDQQASATAARQTDPRDLAAAFDKMSDQAYWDAQRERYGSAPPDRAGGDPQIGPDLPRGFGEDVWEGGPLAFPPGMTPQREGPSPVLPPEGMRWPTLPPTMDLKPLQIFDDAPFPNKRNPPGDPWAMLKVAPLNQMFRAYADPWALDPDVVSAALQARRRIPGLY